MLRVEELEARFRGRAPGVMDLKRRYAVLVPLVEGADGPGLLYEVRSSSVRQPGEICFPGGRMEGAETPVQCALRELEEELSIPRAAVTVLGPMDLLCHRAGFVISPILARVDAQAAARLVCSPAEVERTLLVPLGELLEQRPLEYRYELIPRVPEDFPYEQAGIPRDYPWMRGVEEGPIYLWRGRAIWGLTGRITRWLLEQCREDGHGQD